MSLSWRMNMMRMDSMVLVGFHDLCFLYRIIHFSSTPIILSHSIEEWRRMWVVHSYDSINLYPDPQSISIVDFYHPTVLKDDKEGYYMDEPLGYSNPSLAPSISAPLTCPNLCSYNEEVRRKGERGHGYGVLMCNGLINISTNRTWALWLNR